MTLQALDLACVRGERQLFRDVSFELHSGEALWLQGGNGSGKTSMLRLLSGLGAPQRGEVRWRGRAVRRLREDFHRELIYFGHAGALKDDLTAWENVATSAALAGRACDRARACEALARVGLAAQAGLPARALSQGQRRRVALAQLELPSLPPLLLLDEPFNALDQAAGDALTATLECHLQQGGIVVYTTHQPVRLRPSRLQQLNLESHAVASC